MGIEVWSTSGPDFDSQPPSSYRVRFQEEDFNETFLPAPPGRAWDLRTSGGVTSLLSLSRSAPSVSVPRVSPTDGPRIVDEWSTPTVTTDLLGTLWGPEW